MPDLEQQLNELASAIDWPASPDLRISLPIQARGARRRGWWTWNQRWALPAAAALLIVAIALAAYPPTRTAIADWVNLHVRFQRVEQLPTPSPLPSGTLGDQLGLGLPYTLEDAQRQVTWKITLPSDLGRPDAVYVRNLPALGEVTLVYAKRGDIPVSLETGVAVLVTEVRGRTNRAYFDKMVGPDTTVEDVAVRGHPGYWVSGHPHLFVFTDADGQAFLDPLRLATNTLIFERGDGTIVRIEADISRERALQIAESL